MPRSRVVRVTGLTPTSPRSRVARITGTGGTAAVPRSRVVRVTGAGTAAVVVNPIANRTGVEPESAVNVAASLAGGASADSWTWRRVSGAAIGIEGTGSTVTFAAPSHIDGTSVTVGVRATKDGVTSPEVTFTITVLPQTRWWYVAPGWIPRVTTFA